MSKAKPPTSRFHPYTVTVASDGRRHRATATRPDGIAVATAYGDSPKEAEDLVESLLADLPPLEA